MANLTINNLTKTFRRVKALDDLSLNVKDGEFLILLGPTGAGKTTSLRCVAGLEKPDSGSILMDGAAVDKLSPAVRDVALVFQSYALYPRKTVFQNMAFPLEARSLSRTEIEQRVSEVARKLHIDGLLDRRPAQLSGGQQQRVALGRAMVRQPRVFLMDEPLTNLDFKLRVEMRAELKRLQQELSATFFYVTNDQIEAMSMADRIAVLNHGVLQQVDTPEQVYRHPANLFVAGFIGSPRINFINGTLDSGARLFVSGDGVWRVPVAPEQMARIEQAEGGREVVLGIRSEEIELLRESNNGALPGTVYIVEPLGDKTIIDMQVGSEKIKVKVPPTYEVRSGEALHLHIDPRSVHLFDKASGNALI